MCHTRRERGGTQGTLSTSFILSFIQLCYKCFKCLIYNDRMGGEGGGGNVAISSPSSDISGVTSSHSAASLPLFTKLPLHSNSVIGIRVSDDWTDPVERLLLAVLT